ncbi:hypothetical protein ACEU6E_00005 [Halorutilales archaeon Cl-col2-1]
MRNNPDENWTNITTASSNDKENSQRQAGFGVATTFMALIGIGLIALKEL